METELTFVAPEGVYSQTEEQRPPPVHLTIGGTPAGGITAHSRLSTVVVKFPSSKGGWGIPGIGRKDKEKERDRDRDRDKDKDKDKDKESLSSSDISKEKDDDLIPSSPPGKGKMPLFSPTSPVAPSSLLSGLQSPGPNGLNHSVGGGTGGVSVSNSGGGGAGKKKGPARPKQSARTTSSTFLSRLQTMEGLSRVIAGKVGEVTFLFYNWGKNFFWSETKAKEPFARIAFSAFPTCHDINPATASHEQLDIIIGFDTGDLIWFDPILLRYMRLNKQGCICKSPCTQVRWVPGSPSLFLVSFADGSIITFDKERDDGTFTPEDPDSMSLLSPPSAHSSSSSSASPRSPVLPVAINGSTNVTPQSFTGAMLAASSDINTESIPVTNSHPALPQQPHLSPLAIPPVNANISGTLLTPASPSSPVGRGTYLTNPQLATPSPSSSSSQTFSPETPPAIALLRNTQTISQVSSLQPSLSASHSKRTWDPREDMIVTIPPWYNYGASGGLSSGLGGAVVSPGAGSTGRNDKVMKNPISHWRISRKCVLDFVFSPDLRYVGAVSEDGCLRVIDTLSEKLIDTYGSYFGALTCVAWSPDGRFIITGGQDDLITVISPFEQRVIARCQGHSSFVSSVAFDERKCDGRTYRFGSVGEDNKLIFWDFSSGALHRPKLLPSHAQRQSLSSTVSLVLRRRSETMDRSTLHLPGSPGSHLDAKVSRFHPAPSRNDVAILQPVLVKVLDSTLGANTASTGTGSTGSGSNNAAGDTLTFISFQANAMVTVSKGAIIRFWVRPLPPLHDRGVRRKVRPRGLMREESQTKETEFGSTIDVEDNDLLVDNNTPLHPVQEGVVV